MDVDSLVSEIRTAGAAPVYLFFGPEPFLVETGAAAVVEAALADGLPDFNLDRFDGKGADLDRLLLTARSYPMMAARRVIVLRDADDLQERDQERIADYAREPVPTTTLVLTAGKLDQRKRLFREVKKTGRVVECKKVYESQLPVHIRRMFQTMGKRVEQGAVAELARLVGTDLSLLRSEITKVVLYAGDEPAVTAEHVRAVVTDVRQESVFDLADAVAARQASAALRALGRIVESGEGETRLLFMIARHLRTLLVAKDAMGRGQPLREVLGALGVPSFAMGKYEAQLASFPEPLLRRAYRDVCQADFTLKSSRLPGKLVLETLILDLCAG